MYGAVPYRFPAAGRLNLSSAVSQALVCGRPWSDTAVVAEAQLLLGPDRRAAQHHIDRSRLEALSRFKAAYQEQELAERACFGENSYYAQFDK